MNPDEVLLKLGLSQKEAAIYLSALSLGETTISELSRHSKTKRPTTYLAVETLLRKGLLSEVKLKRGRLLSPTNPRTITSMLQRDLEAAIEIIPDLTTIYNAPAKKPKIQIFRERRGMQIAYQSLYEALDDRKEALWFTRIDTLQNIPHIVEGYINVLKKLKDPKIRELNSGIEASRQWAQKLRPYRGSNHHIRALPKNCEFGHTDNLIFGNTIAIFSLKKDIFVTIIENQEIAETYRTLFNLTWNSGTEIA